MVGLVLTTKQELIIPEFESSKLVFNKDYYIQASELLGNRSHSVVIFCELQSITTKKMGTKLRLTYPGGNEVFFMKLELTRWALDLSKRYSVHSYLLTIINDGWPDEQSVLATIFSGDPDLWDCLVGNQEKYYSIDCCYYIPK